MAAEASEGSIPVSRQERGKIAQREYRKRHANKFRILQEENKRLRRAIADIGKVVSGDERTWAELELALTSARAAASAELEDPRSEDIFAARPSTERPAARLPADSALPLESPPGMQSVPEGGADAAGLVTWPNKFPAANLGIPLQLTEKTLWTVSGFLTWICTHYTAALWRHVHAGSAVTNLEQFVLANMVNSTSDLNGSTPAPPSAYHECPHGAQPPASHHDLALLAQRYENQRQQSFETMRRGGWWKSPSDVEDQMRSMARPEELQRLQAALEGRGPDLDTTPLARLFVGMCRNFVRFPDGPRWNTMYVTIATGLWIRSMREDHRIVHIAD
ncbi:hypothetical protein S40285_06755 [Stachybotrys chlorohalonatus IBT 40285]|uniref:BZIP domain-containing protein n=1 Tax=Stachybotrys chlorohalonatus (strain IBT 40285) TaxID=1283841 RepID=A0A084QJV8_STAC4|nr:hypothetical protein S40285_06755 [Stachybotrys chlorohalonata IBT 40285]